MKTRTIGLCLVLGSFLWIAGLAQEQPLTDQEITRAVETELLVTEQIHSQLLNVETENGIVMLDGTAKTLLQKEQALRIAETVKGVRSVIDRVKVEAEERPDLAIQTDVESALLVDPVAEAFQIDVVVTNGVVTLTGTVESWAERQLVKDIAQSVRGVREVKNDINVEMTNERPDYEIEQEIKAMLKNDVRINENLITVSVENGNVELGGAVGSAYQKRQASYKAWAPGVQSVNAENLEVQWWARDELLKTDPTEITDEQIEQAIKDAYLWDPRVYKFNPEISVSNGVVTLKGVVEDLRAKRAAVEDAKNTAGVWHVVNLITVEPQLDVEDMELQERVKAAFDRNPFLNDRTIKVYAFDGHVYLTGHVPFYYQKQRAEDVAAQVAGVREVTNELATEDAWVYKEDWELEGDVQRELFWNPLVDEADVNVRVDDGVVFLTGKVNNITEYKAAEEEAEEAGAMSVANYLEIAHMPESFNRENLR